ncbi:MAG TPA: hypothetical protein VGD54_00025 [Steroidobacteraceae bacterium]
MERLQQVLILLGYHDHLEPWHRNNIVKAISDFASLKNDGELVKACEKELDRIYDSVPADQKVPRSK